MKVLVLLGHLNGEAETVRSLSPLPVVEVGAPVQLTELAQAGRVGAVVYGGGYRSAIRGREVVSALTCCRAPLIVRAAPDPLGHLDLIECAGYGDGLHLAEIDTISSLVSTAAEGRCAPSPSADLVMRFALRANAELQGLVVAAIATGQQRTTVSRFTAAAGRPDRTVRDQLRAAGWPRPKAMPAWFTGVYVAYFTGRIGCSLKEVAYRTNAASVDDLRRYLVTRTGRTPSDWRAIGYEGALQLLERTFITSEMHPPKPAGLAPISHGISPETSLFGARIALVS